MYSTNTTSNRINARPNFTELPDTDSYSRPSAAQQVYDEYRAKRPLTAPFRKAGDVHRAGGGGGSSIPNNGGGGASPYFATTPQRNNFFSSPTSTAANTSTASSNTANNDSNHNTHYKGNTTDRMSFAYTTNLQLDRPLSMPGLRGSSPSGGGQGHLLGSPAKTRRPASALTRTGPSTYTDATAAISLGEAPPTNTHAVDDETQGVSSSGGGSEAAAPTPALEPFLSASTLKAHHSYLCDVMVALWSELGVRTSAERYRHWTSSSPSVVLAVCTPQGVKELQQAILRLLERVPADAPPQAMDEKHHAFLFGDNDRTPVSRANTIRRVIQLVSKKLLAQAEVNAKGGSLSSPHNTTTASSHDASTAFSAARSPIGRPQSAASARGSVHHSHHNGVTNGGTTTPVVIHTNNFNNSHSNPSSGATPSASRPQSAALYRSTYSAMSMPPPSYTLEGEHIRRVGAPSRPDMSPFHHNSSYYVYTDTSSASMLASPSRGVPRTSAAVSYSSPTMLTNRITVSSVDMVDRGTGMTPPVGVSRRESTASQRPIGSAAHVDSHSSGPATTTSTTTITTPANEAGGDTYFVPRKVFSPEEHAAAEWPRLEAQFLDEEAEGRAVIAALQSNLRDRVAKVMVREGERIKAYASVAEVSSATSRTGGFASSSAAVSRRPSEIMRQRDESEQLMVSYVTGTSPIRARHRAAELLEKETNALAAAEADGRMALLEAERGARLAAEADVYVYAEEQEERLYIERTLEAQGREDIRFKMHYAGMDLFPEERAVVTAAYLEQYQIECEESSERKELQRAIKGFIDEELLGLKAEGAAAAIQQQYRKYLEQTGRSGVRGPSSSPQRDDANEDSGPVVAAEDDYEAYIPEDDSPAIADEEEDDTARSEQQSHVDERRASEVNQQEEQQQREGREREAAEEEAHRRDNAAIYIQRTARGYLARRERHQREKERQQEVFLQRRTEAAVRIQCQCRNHLARKELSRRRLERKPSAYTVSSSVASGAASSRAYSHRGFGGAAGRGGRDDAPISTVVPTTNTPFIPEDVNVVTSADTSVVREAGNTSSVHHTASNSNANQLVRTPSKLSVSRVSYASTTPTVVRGGLSKTLVGGAVAAAEQLRAAGGAPTPAAASRADSYRDLLGSSGLQPQQQVQPPHQGGVSVGEVGGSPTMSSKRSSILAAAAAAGTTAGMALPTVDALPSSGPQRLLADDNRSSTRNNSTHNNTAPSNVSAVRAISTAKTMGTTPSIVGTAASAAGTARSAGTSTIVRHARINAVLEFIDSMERVRADEADTRTMLEEDELFDLYVCQCHWPMRFPIPLIEHAQPQDYGLLTKEEAAAFDAIADAERTALEKIIQKAAAEEIARRKGSSAVVPPVVDGSGGSPDESGANRPRPSSRPGSARLMDALRRSSSNASSVAEKKVGDGGSTTDPLAPKGLTPSYAAKPSGQSLASSQL